MTSNLCNAANPSSSPFYRALRRIPWQLRRPEIRFTIIPLSQKSPIGKAWDEPGGSNYGHVDPMLAGYLASGWNYGVVTGLSGLAVVDIDNMQEAEALGIPARLPRTFQVRTGGGGQHHYYWCPGIRRISFYHQEKLDACGSALHLGEVQCEGQQVVAPGSLHKSGRRYEVLRDVAISSITEQEIIQALVGLKFSRAKEKGLKTAGHAEELQAPRDKDGILLGALIPIDSIAWPRGQVERHGLEVRGAHPPHDSASEDNFSINLGQNCWHCWRHETGGGPLEFLAMQMGLLDCAEARPGCLKDVFPKVVREARRKGYCLPGEKR
jgi:hypothetical protein